jgi:hypothetical protein
MSAATSFKGYPLPCGVLAACALWTSACGGAPSGKAVRETLDTMDPQQRRATFEATAQALDTRPELVDEFYSVARRHPKMFNRFLGNTARDLDDPQLAHATALLLVAHPASLEQMLHKTLDAVEDHEDARATVARVMEARRVVVASILTDRPSAVRASMNATLEQVQSKPAAQSELLRSMRESSNRVAAVLADDPRTLAVLVQAMLDEGVELEMLKESLSKVLDAS